MSACPIDSLQPLSPSYSPNLRHRYTLHRIIGRGHYGVVHFASLKLDPKETFAIKAISKKKIRAAKVIAEREVCILRQLDHPNVIKLVEVYEDFRYVYLVMEYCAGGDLFARIETIGRYEEKEAARVMWKIMLAIHHLHMNKICHRDLKPENFMFTTTNSVTSELKLIDFGLSTKFSLPIPFSTELKSMVGTPAYLPPEVLMGKYGPKCDMWSAGVILYVLLSASLPFKGSTADETYDKIGKGKFGFEGKAWELVSEKAKDLIGKLIVLDPGKRLGVEAAMRHPWFKGVTFEEPMIDYEVVKTIQGLKQRTQFQIETFSLMVKRFKDDRLREIKETFMAFDMQNDGVITAAGLRIGLESIGLKLGNRELEGIVRNASRRKEGKVKYSEFVAAAIESHALLTYETMLAAFRCFDSENTGRITELNIAETLRRAGRKLEEKLFKKMISEAKITERGITFDEFRQLLKQ